MTTLFLWLIRLVTAILMVVTLLPLLETGAWWVRMWDFPRVQFSVTAAIMLLALALHAGLSGRRREHAAWLAILLIVGGMQFAKIVPFTELWPVEVPAAQVATQATTTASASSSTSSGKSLTMMAANVRFENERYDEVLALFTKHSPDLLLVLELNAAWATALKPLDTIYPYRIGIIKEEGLGMMLWSKQPLKETSTEYLVSDKRPSVFAQLTVQPQSEPLRIAGLHPTPPALQDRINHNHHAPNERRDSRVRDAELMLVAKRIQQQPNRRWLVIGDLNDVGWSSSVQLFKKSSGLLDPRIGRQLLNTYSANQPLLRIPIDHIFVSDGFELQNMQRLRIPGSDHFAVLAALQISKKNPKQNQLKAEDNEEAQELIREGNKDAAERQVSD